MADEQLRLQVCETWSVLVRSLSPETLGPCLSQIIVSLTPYCDDSKASGPASSSSSLVDSKDSKDSKLSSKEQKGSAHAGVASKACGIVNFLIVDNKSSLRQFFKQIPLLPQIPALESALKVLRAELGHISLPHRLQQLINNCSHENSNVRALTLSQITVLLQTNRMQFEANPLEGAVRFSCCSN